MAVVDAMNRTIAVMVVVVVMIPTMIAVCVVVRGRVGGYSKKKKKPWTRAGQQ